MSVVINTVRAMASNLTSIDVFKLSRETAKELSTELEQIFRAGVVPDPVAAACVASKQVMLLALLGELEDRGVLGDVEDYLKKWALYALPRASGHVG
jgi:hypothetical protein